MGGARGKDEMLDDFGTRASAKLKSRSWTGYGSVVETEIHPSGSEQATRICVSWKTAGGELEEVAKEDFEGSIADAFQHVSEIVGKDAARRFPHP